MVKDFVVNKRAFSKMVYQILSIVIKIYKVSWLRTSSWYFSNHSLTLLTSHHLHLKYINHYCDTVFFIVLLWSVEKYLLLWRKENLSCSFSVERFIFQGGGLTPAILCKSIIHYRILKVQSRKLKKNYNEMIASTWKINLEIVAYLIIKILESFTSKFKYLGIKVNKKSDFY